MKLYIVRHGETVGNAQNQHQFASTPLSDIGESQAKLVAYRFKSIPIDIILSSDLERTKQTALIISSTINKPIEYTQLLREIKRPSEIEGKRVDSPEVLKIKQQISNHKDDPSWHYSDEENFFDFKTRIIQSLKLIENRSEQNILLVTHGLTLCMLMGIIVFGESIPENISHSMYSKFHNINTGLTMMDYTNESWHINTWNDHAHLG